MIDKKTVTAVILVAGNSTRYGQNRNKNFEMLNGKMVLEYSLNAFDTNNYIDNIIIVSKEDEKEIVEKILEKQSLQKEVTVVVGGKTRQESVYNAISTTTSDIAIINDGQILFIKKI